jgi:hypothetical protein
VKGYAHRRGWVAVYKGTTRVEDSQPAMASDCAAGDEGVVVSTPLRVAHEVSASKRRRLRAQRWTRLGGGHRWVVCLGRVTTTPLMF